MALNNLWKGVANKAKVLHVGNIARILTAIIILLLIASVIYEHVRIGDLKTELTLAMDTQNASTTARVDSALSDALAKMSGSLTAQEQNLNQQLGSVQSQVGNMAGTVSTLQKLTTTDKEFLAKYSKVFFLNENYMPARLTEIPLNYQYSDKKQLLFQTDAWPHLKQMIDDAAKSNVKMMISSAYRSFGEQQALKGDYKIIYGAGTANSFSADQGYSEHQLGTTVDFIESGLGGVLDDRYAGTDSYLWLQNNAWRYGFILSYPKGNDYYVFEPWHWRFVGVKLATDLHNQGKSFYDLDQRVIDGYLANLFD